VKPKQCRSFLLNAKAKRFFGNTQKKANKFLFAFTKEYIKSLKINILGDLLLKQVILFDFLAQMCSVQALLHIKQGFH